jgi:hypothetical protein
MKSRSISALVPAVLAFLALAATSWAYFGSIGSGSGSGSADVSRVVTIGAGTTPNATLLPTGQPTGMLSVSIQNATAGALRVDSLQLNTALGNGGYSPDAVTCKLAYTTQSVERTISAATTEQISLQGAVTMGADAPATCQGKTFTIYLKAS